MVEIKHRKQVNDGVNWKCGVACLEMIFEYYGIEYDSDDIWEKIKTPRPNTWNHFYAHTHSLVKYAIEKGLNATAYKAKSDTCLEVLKKLDEISIPAILAIREPKSGQSHFVVYTGIKNKMYYYCDPNSNRAFSYFKQGELEDVWSPQPEIGVTGYFLVLFDHKNDDTVFCKQCGSPVPIVYNELQTKMEGVACPYCGSAALIYD